LDALKRSQSRVPVATRLRELRAALIQPILKSDGVGFESPALVDGEPVVGAQTIPLAIRSLIKLSGFCPQARRLTWIRFGRRVCASERRGTLEPHHFRAADRIRCTPPLIPGKQDQKEERSCARCEDANPGALLP
jgi:hypothetical protein